MHILNINFINFTAQVYNALHVLGEKGRLLASWGHDSFPFKSAYVNNLGM